MATPNTTLKMASSLRRGDAILDGSGALMGLVSSVSTLRVTFIPVGLPNIRRSFTYDDDMTFETLHYAIDLEAADREFALLEDDKDDGAIFDALFRGRILDSLIPQYAPNGTDNLLFGSDAREFVETWIEKL